MAEEMVLVYYLIKNRPLQINFNDIGTRTFSPAALITKHHAQKLLAKRKIFGGCCGKPQVTLPIFATQEQLESGERGWIE